MSIYKDPKGGENWFVYIKHGGKQIRRSTGTTDETAAQRFHDQLKAELWNTPVEPSGVTWLDACADWLTTTSKRGKPRSESDKYSLNELNYNYPDRALSECDALSLKKAIGDKKPATFNRIATIVNAVVNLAVANGHLNKGFKVAKHATPKVSYRFLSEEEWLALYEALPEHLKAPASLSLATGLRQANTFGLVWRNVDLKRKTVWVLPEESKSNQPINIPLSKAAIAVLQGQVGKHDDWVFPYEGRGRAAGRPVSGVKNAFQDACHRAGVGVVTKWQTPDQKWHRKYEGFSWHDFRHTFASWHIMGGTKIEVLKVLGGWSDLRMVERYAHLDPGYVAQWADNAKPWSQKKALESA